MFAAFGVAMIVALFAYNGWWYSTFVAGEVREPQRAIPISIYAGMSVVLVVYALANSRIQPLAATGRRPPRAAAAGAVAINAQMVPAASPHSSRSALSDTTIVSSPPRR